MRKVYEIDDATMLALRKALEGAVIKAALDGRRTDKEAYETALKDVQSALVGQLSDRPACITCHLTRQELTDIETAISYYHNAFASGAISRAVILHRMRSLLDRLRTTIELNPVTNS